MGDDSSIDLFNILLFEQHKVKILGLEQVHRLMTGSLFGQRCFVLIVIDEEDPLSEEVADPPHLVLIVIDRILTFYLGHRVHQLGQLPRPDQRLLSRDNPIHGSLGSDAFLHQIEQSFLLELRGQLLQLGLAGIQEADRAPVLVAHLQVLHQEDGRQDGERQSDPVGDQLAEVYSRDALKSTVDLVCELLELVPVGLAGVLHCSQEEFGSVLLQRA